MSKTANIITWMLFIATVVVYNLWSIRYWASYPATLYYASSIVNIHSVHCFDLAYKAKKLENDKMFFLKNWNNTEDVVSESELNYIAWKCTNHILKNINNAPISDFDWLWFGDSWTTDAVIMRKSGDREKKWMIAWMFFPAQKIPWTESLSWSTYELFVFSKIREAGKLWSKSDDQSYNNCRTIMEDKFNNKKDPPSNFLVDDCVNEIHRYLIMSSTKFVKIF